MIKKRKMAEQEEQNTKPSCLQTDDISCYFAEQTPITWNGTVEELEQNLNKDIPEQEWEDDDSDSEPPYSLKGTAT